MNEEAMPPSHPSSKKVPQFFEDGCKALQYFDFRSTKMFGAGVDLVLLGFWNPRAPNFYLV